MGDIDNWDAGEEGDMQLLPVRTMFVPKPKADCRAHRTKMASVFQKRDSYFLDHRASEAISRLQY